MTGPSSFSACYWRNNITAICLALMLGITSKAYAINRCQDAAGNMVFTDTPCEGGVTAVVSPHQERRRTDSTISGASVPADHNLQSMGALTDDSDYCVASFRKPFVMKDVADRIQLLIPADSRYYLSRNLTFGGEYETILYPAEGGVAVYRFTYEGDRPFVTHCTERNLKQVVATFVDLTLYSSENFTKENCRIPAGTVMPGATYALYKGSGVISWPGHKCDGFFKTNKATIMGEEKEVFPAHLISPR